VATRDVQGIGERALVVLVGLADVERLRARLDAVEKKTEIKNNDRRIKKLK